MDAAVAVPPRAIDLGTERPFRVGGASIDPASRDARFNGSVERLQPQNLKVLIALARRRREVVTREDLVDLCWDGRFVGEDVINRAISTLRQFAERAGGFSIETVPRAGYRLVETSWSSWTGWPRWIAAIIGILALVAIIWLNGGPSHSGPAHPRTIAVLPLDASSDQEGLASGVSEEIVSRLSRNPRIAPLGRGSSRILGDDPSTAIALGRELRVDYLLSGRLEDRGRDLTITARLIRTADGTVAWNDTVNGGIAELIPMMDRLSSEVSRRIGAGSLPPARNKPPKPEANQLYLSALGLARGYEPEKVSTAVELLRQASRIDPDYAPIWSALGSLIRAQHLQHLKPQGDQSGNLLEQAYARRGIELAPDSAAANLAMGDTLAEDPRSIPYVLRAIEIDPHNADAWFTLSDKYLKAGDFVRWNQALNKGATLDPLPMWNTLSAADSNHELGYEDQARRQIQFLYKHGQPQPYTRHMMAGFDAMAESDLSRALDEFTQAARSPNAQVWANSVRGQIFFAVGMLDEARPLSGVISPNPEDWDLNNGRDPGPYALDVGRKYPVYAWNMQERNYLLLRILVKGKRYADVAGLYDRRFQSPDEFSHTPRGHVSFIDDSIPVVLALRQVGREREAGRIYALARDAVAKRYRAGPVPPYYEVLAAQLYAIGGNQAAALDSLTRAVNRGWLNRLSSSMPSIADEPAFSSLRGNPRFEALRKRMESLYQRERAEILTARARSAADGS
ncbi:MAG: winged helix-turn-helix domain-containing protein [Sphingomicrobium sp.]